MSSGPRPVPMLDLVRLHAPLREELAAALDATLALGRFIGGPEVERFEGRLAERAGARHAVGVSSGTDALVVALLALGVVPGDEVITTPFTFFATAGAAARLGARPVFADIDPVTLNLDPSAVAATIGPRTVGIVPVHLFGQCAEMGALNELAERHGLWVLEDAAQALGASLDGRPAGGHGTLGAFSFFPAKNLGALGDAGAVVTDDGDLARRLRALRQHGAERKYHHHRVGGNFRLDALQAAFLSVKLPHLDGWDEGRRRVAARYDRLLAGLPGVVLPVEVAGRRHVYNQYVIRLPGRDRVRAALSEAGIASAVYYPLPLHLQPCFAELQYAAGDFPVAEGAASEALALPPDPLLEEADQRRIAEIIERALP